MKKLYKEQTILNMVLEPVLSHKMLQNFNFSLIDLKLVLCMQIAIMYSKKLSHLEGIKIQESADN